MVSKTLDGRENSWNFSEKRRKESLVKYSVLYSRAPSQMVLVALRCALAHVSRAAQFTSHKSRSTVASLTSFTRPKPSDSSISLTPLTDDVDPATCYLLQCCLAHPIQRSRVCLSRARIIRLQPGGAAFPCTAAQYFHDQNASVVFRFARVASTVRHLVAKHRLCNCTPCFAR